MAWRKWVYLAFLLWWKGAFWMYPWLLAHLIWSWRCQGGCRRSLRSSQLQVLIRSYGIVSVGVCLRTFQLICIIINIIIQCTILSSWERPTHSSSGMPPSRLSNGLTPPVHLVPFSTSQSHSATHSWWYLLVLCRRRKEDRHWGVSKKIRSEWIQ